MPKIQKNRGRPSNKRGQKRNILNIVKKHATPERKTQMKTRNKYFKKQKKENEKNEKILEKKEKIIKKQKKQIELLNNDNNELQIENTGFCFFF